MVPVKPSRGPLIPGTRHADSVLNYVAVCAMRLSLAFRPRSACLALGVEVLLYSMCYQYLRSIGAFKV